MILKFLSPFSNKKNKSKFIKIKITMTENLLNYIIIGFTGILAVFSFVMWIEKMIKIILGNYILTGICLSATQAINLLVNYLNTDPTAKIIWLSYEIIAKFFDYGQTTLVLVLYAILLIIIYLKSKIMIQLPMDEWVQKSFFIILVPLTVISIILTLQIAILWINIIDANTLSTISSDSIAYKFFSLTPVRILLHWLATILITSELKINIKTNI